MDSETTTRVVHEDDVEWTDFEHGRFAGRRKSLGRSAGGRKLGCSLYELPPGRRSFPYHYHWGNEEAIYVLQGEGTMRLAGRELPLRRGDYVAFPVGEEGAHQIVNTSDAALRYLCFSTMIDPEIVVYPDSGKLGMMAGSAPGASRDRALRVIVKSDSGVDYFEGEQ